MSKSEIHFVKQLNPIAGDPSEPIMETLLSAGIPVASSCGGQGICTKCKIRVLAGAENLSPASELEERALARQLLEPDQRLSCQAQILKSSITIDTDYW